MTRADGGPAFPGERTMHLAETETGPTKSFQVYCGGMTLRDYFAAKAMAAIITGNPQESGWRPNAERTAYLIADAMIAERAK